jgi:hypothetical protein
VDWLAACISKSAEWLALYLSISSGVGENLHNPPANGKQGSIPEEMSQTLLTNKKLGKLD